MFRVYFHEEFDKQDLTIHEQEGKVFFFEYVKGRRGRKLPERNIFRTNETSDYMRNLGRERSYDCQITGQFNMAQETNIGYVWDHFTASHHSFRGMALNRRCGSVRS